MYSNPDAYRLLDGIYWALWLFAFGAALAALVSTNIRLHALALCVILAAEGCWLLLSLPYPGSIERAVSASATSPGVLRLPSAFAGWDRVELAPAEGDAQLTELAARGGPERFAEIALAPGDPAVPVDLGSFVRRTDSARAGRVAAIDCGGAASPQVTVFAAGRWLVSAGEVSRPWKDLRAGWSVARRVRGWLCWGGVLFGVLVTLNLVRIVLRR